MRVREEITIRLLRYMRMSDHFWSFSVGANEGPKAGLVFCAALGDVLIRSGTPYSKEKIDTFGEDLPSNNVGIADILRTWKKAISCLPLLIWLDLVCF